MSTGHAVTFLSGRNCDFSNGDRHRFAGRSTAWPGDGSPAQAFCRAAPQIKDLYQPSYPATGFAQVRLVSEAMRSVICIRLFQASQHASRMAS